MAHIFCSILYKSGLALAQPVFSLPTANPSCTRVLNVMTDTDLSLKTFSLNVYRYAPFVTENELIQKIEI